MSLLNSLIPIAIDSEGRTYPEAYLYSYDVGTNTPKATYSDSGLLTPNANPLQADGAGRFFDIYLGAGGYKLKLTDKFGVEIWTQDNYYQAADATDIANLQAEIDANEQFLPKSVGVYTDTGAADAYVLTYASTGTAPTAYANNMMITFKPANANTGASTVNVQALGSRNLYDESGNALAASFLETSAYYTFIYTSSNFRFFSKGGLVDSGYIAADAVVTSKIADKNVTLPKIADGTAHDIIAYDSSGVATTIDNPMRLLTSGSFTAAASLQFVLSTLQTAQSVNNSYLIRLVGCQPATDDVELWMTLSSDAGSTYASTAYYSSVIGYASNASTLTQVYNNGAQIIVAGFSAATGALSNAADETATIDIRLNLVNTGTSKNPAIYTSGGFITAAGSSTTTSGYATRLTPADYDAVKFTWEGGGNFAAVGQYYIYAIPNTI